MAEDDEIVSDRIEVPHYPWHRPIWLRLTAHSERLPHALLLHGQRGLGKLAFALRLARALLCLQPHVCGDEGVTACGQCRSCVWFAAGTHPDWLRLSPAEEGKPITVDQVRAIVEFLALRPHTAGRQIVVIAPAEAMNVNAANSLLKVLEEPTAESYFFLVSHQPARLPATVRSRCQRVAFKPPAAAEALAWLTQQTEVPLQEAAGLLAFAGGSPLEALQYRREGLGAQPANLLAELQALAAGREDPLACAARWVELGVTRVLDWVYLAVTTLIEQAAASTLERQENTNKVIYLFAFLDVVLKTKRAFPGPLDAQLALENLFLEWCRLHKGKDLKLA